MSPFMNLVGPSQSSMMKTIRNHQERIENEQSNRSDESGDDVNEGGTRGVGNKFFGDKQSVSFSGVKNSVIFPLQQSSFHSPMPHKNN